jgi:hypothetical protein
MKSASGARSGIQITVICTEAKDTDQRVPDNRIIYTKEISPEISMSFEV